MNTEEFKTRLLDEKHLLEQSLAIVAVPDEHAEGGFRGKEDDFSSEPQSLDPVELGTELESLARNESITNDLEARYKNVIDALKKIELGTYGICEVSGDPIELDRLDANPAARTNKANMGE